MSVSAYSGWGSGVVPQPLGVYMVEVFFLVALVALLVGVLLITREK